MYNLTEKRAHFYIVIEAITYSSSIISEIFINHFDFYFLNILFNFNNQKKSYILICNYWATIVKTYTSILSYTASLVIRLVVVLRCCQEPLKNI